MGALEITQRRASLGNLGDVRQINTDIGVEQAANRVASSMRRLAQSNIDLAGAGGAIGKAIGEGMINVSAPMASLVSAIGALEEEEARRRADEYANRFKGKMQRYNSGDGGTGEYALRFKSKMLEHNSGDGNGSGGAMNAVIPESDRGEWMAENTEAAKKIHAEVLEDMGINEDDFKDSRMQKWRDSFMFTQNAQWLEKRNRAMSAYADMEAAKKYENDRSDVTADLVREGAWKDISDSMERLIARKGLGQEAAAAFRRKEGETICGIGIKKMIDEATGNAVAAGAEGGAVFDKLIMDWEENLDDASFLPPASNITEDDGHGHVTKRNPLKEWLTGADMKSLKAAAVKDAKAAKSGWEAGMRKHTKEQFANAQNDILAIPAPEDGDEVGQKNYQREVADAYRRLIAKDPRVLSGRGDEWVRDDLKKFAPEKVAVALRAIKGADDRADRARVRANGQLFTRAVQFGVVDPEAPGGFRQLSASEKLNMAEFMFTNGEISHEDYAKAIKASGEQSSPLVTAFFQRIAKGLNAKFPNVCEWQADKMRFKFRDTKEARELAAKSNGVETTVAWDDVVQGKVVKKVDREETWTYGQYADAASLVAEKIILAGPRKGESDAELLDRAEQEFRRLTVGTEDDVMRLSIKRRTEEYRKNVETLKNVRRGKMGVRFLPQGIELSRQTKAKVRASAKKDEEDK